MEGVKVLWQVIVLYHHNRITNGFPFPNNLISYLFEGCFHHGQNNHVFVQRKSQLNEINTRKAKPLVWNDCVLKQE